MLGLQRFAGERKSMRQLQFELKTDRRVYDTNFYKMLLPTELVV